MRRPLPPSATALFACAILFATALHAGAPLKGVDVKLGKAPGGTPAGARTTDDQGRFDFGVLPKGTYTLTLSIPKAGATGAATGVAMGTCLVEIHGSGNGVMKVEWDLGKNKPSLVQAQTARGTSGDAITIESDGQHPLNGAVVKSKSNITNN